jgi:ubiquinone/menaquinone biosynthesis C-methylase UbiE
MIEINTYRRMITVQDTKTITEAVRDRYKAIAEKSGSCCGPSCCDESVSDMSLGYTAEELASIPEGANLSLGCGNPTGLATIKSGETVIDLGSGAGIDCFLAAQKVGASGHVIGIDMTEAMIQKARENAAKAGHANVEFRLGQIENMPVANSTADIVISNCVINLAPDKSRVFAEIFRVLRPGGRFVVSDVVAKGEIPEADRRDMELWAGCIAGALERGKYLEIVRTAGFVDLDIKAEVEYDYKKSEQFALLSMTLEAHKPLA